MSSIPSHRTHGGDPVPGPAGASARLLILGDSHGDARWISRAFEAATQHGCVGVVQLGDFGFWPSARVLRRTGHVVLDEAWLDEVAAAAHAHSTWLRVLDGNHDAHPLARNAFPAIDDRSPIRPIRSGLLDWADRGAAWTWCGVRFGALGGGFSIDLGSRVEGRSWWPTETITEPELARLTNKGALDVLLTHDAPAEADVPGLLAIGAELERRSVTNRKMVSRAVAATGPKLILHGHLHVAHEARIAIENSRTAQVIGLASNLEGAPAGRGILDIPSLSFRRV